MWEFVDYNLASRSKVRLQQANEEIAFWSLVIEDGVENALWCADEDEDEDCEWFEEEDEDEVADVASVDLGSICGQDDCEVDPDSTCASSWKDEAVDDDQVSSVDSIATSSWMTASSDRTEMHDVQEAKKGFLWILANKRAELNTKEYFRTEELRKQRLEEERLAREADKFAAPPPPPPPPKELTPFEKLCDSFLEQHEQMLTQELGRVLVTPIRFERIEMGRYPVDSFMFKRRQYTVLEPLIHGTRAHNFPSIFSRGLVIPTRGSGVSVVNGSAHGVGIYTTRPPSAATSRGYSDIGRLLVCALARNDKDDVSIKRPNSGVAVIFEEARVIPMFQAIGANALTLDPPLPPPPPPAPVKGRAKKVYRPRSLKPTVKLGLDIRRERRHIRRAQVQDTRREQHQRLAAQFGSPSLVHIVSFLDRSAARKRR